MSRVVGNNIKEHPSQENTGRRTTDRNRQTEKQERERREKKETIDRRFRLSENDE